MFLLMVRVTDPLMPRAMFGVLNTVLYFPSGAVYPQQGFPGWMQVIAVVDPFTYAVHAFKSLLLKNTGFEAIGGDLAIPGAFLGRRDDARRRCCSSERCSEAVAAAEEFPSRAARTGPAVGPIARRASGCSTARAAVCGAGFKRVTVRDICRAADANVAAVNYHFGDKLGPLPRGLDEAVDDDEGDHARRARQGRAARRAEIPRLHPRVPAACRVGRASLVDPPDDDARDGRAHRRARTRGAAGDRPRIDYMGELVADILDVPTTDERVLRCVLSVQSQFHAAMANPVSKRLVPGFTGDPAAVDRLAQHIADFSIGGIRSLRKR